ncbi:MAG TPA: universal stress protein [Candidatus Binataceae bacterium]|nr:universal stress protein [Candidatus Binataceae bacterium]
MARFRKILCPIDFDHDFTQAIEIARELAEANDATVHVLHVARIPNQDMDVPLPLRPNPRWERAARVKLESIVRDRLAGVRTQIHVISGTPDDDVVRMANELRVDLVVMTTHGRKGLNHFILGSVAERVMREADCPVLTMRTRRRAVATPAAD